MKLVKASIEDFNKVKAAYIDMIEHSPDMDKYARWDYGTHPNDDLIRGYIENEHMYMLMDEEKLAGVVAITFFQGDDYHTTKWQIEAEDDQVISFHLLGIMPEYQKSGAGRNLLDLALAMGEEKGMKTCRLDTLASNIPAQKFYEKYGFTLCGKQHWYATNTGWTDFLLYELVLDKLPRD